MLKKKCYANLDRTLPLTIEWAVVSAMIIINTLNIREEPMMLAFMFLVFGIFIGAYSTRLKHN